MPDIISTPAVQIGVLLVVLIAMIAGSFWLLARFRDYTVQDQGSTPEALIKLEEMHRKGDISDLEFRTIKATTHQQLDETGSGGERLETDDTSPSSQS